tara:strand:- start:526 stop:717 length:192 start_codon:yes stop_codon:yes gene_type:complete
MASLEEELLKKRLKNKKKITEFFKKRKDIPAAAGEKEIKFLSEMGGTVEEDIFKKIKALLPKR